MDFIDPTGTTLTPGDPIRCKGNGMTRDEDGQLIECCCDECDYFLDCFDRYGNPYEGDKQQ